MAKMSGNSAKSKVTGLRAKRVADMTKNKDPKAMVTGNKLNRSGVDMPKSKGKKPIMKAKSMPKMG